MKVLLENISKVAIQNDEEIDTTIPFEGDWLGFDAASVDGIKSLEKKLDIKLPADYVSFLKTTNGFRKFCSIDSGFESVDKIDYLINTKEQIASLWFDLEHDLPYTVSGLKSSILIGGFGSAEQQFLLIPPSKEYDNWRYWLFSNWGNGEIEYNSLQEYFEESLDQIKSS